MAPTRLSPKSRSRRRLSGMALIYKTTMSPTKFEMLAAWLPGQLWFDGDAAQIKPLGSYRFDDPAGEVGMEGHLVTAGDARVFHVPLTYRGAPLEGGEDFLLDTPAHGVLGTRWVSDALGDPVYRQTLARTIAEGGREADETVENAAGERSEREIFTRLRGSGESGAEAPDFTAAEVTQTGLETLATSGGTVLTVRRVLDPALFDREGSLPLPEGTQTLHATWPGQPVPVVIATLAAR